MLYYINNKMFEVINSLETYIYKSVLERPGHYKDKQEIEYYNNTKDIGWRLADKKDFDIFLLEECTIIHPNENVIDKIENVKLTGGKLEFDKFRYERKRKTEDFVKDESDYNIQHYIVSIINKKR